MMEDRVYSVKETLYHDPYYQRHIVGAPRITSVEKTAEGERIHSAANYAVLRTKLDKESTVYNVGFYRDVIVRTAIGLKFESRLCVYDSEMIANSVIYPI
jgi:salicylate 5-hydroxylase small subunit